MRQKETLSTALARACFSIPNAALPVIEALVLVIVLAAAWRDRSVMPLVPTSDLDTWGYLNPALSWLGGLGFQQTGGRDWLYPALLALFLKTKGSFIGIVLWQKALGISSGIFMALAWRCWVSTLPLQRRACFLVSLIGVVPILVQMLNPQSIFFEMAIRPEAVLPFFVYAQLACLMGYYKYRWRTPKALPSMLLGVAAIILSYACLVLKPSWSLAFVFTSAPVFVGVFGRAPSSIMARVAAPALGIVLSFLILRLPGEVLVIKDSASRTFLPATLFTIHARLIKNSLEAKLARMPDSDPGKARLQALVTVLDNEFQVAESWPGAYRALGYDPDYLYYRSSLVPAIYRYTGQDDEKFRAFCISCYKDSALHDPWGFGKKIEGQFAYFLFPRREIFYKAVHKFALAYKESPLGLPPALPERCRANVQEMFLQYQADLAQQAGSGLSLRGRSSLLKVRELFAWLVWPVEILFLLSFAASLIWTPIRDLRLSGWAAVSLFSAPLGNALTVSVVHALDLDRYRMTYGAYVLFALVAMAVFGVLAIVRSRRAMGAVSREPS